MPGVIVEQYDGSASRGPENHGLDAGHTRLLIVKETGEVEEIFRGKEFDPLVWQQRMDKYGYKSYLDIISKGEK